jgi:hypothetical protein
MRFSTDATIRDLLQRYGDNEAALIQVKQIYYLTEEPHKKAFWEEVMDVLDEK